MWDDDRGGVAASALADWTGLRSRFSPHWLAWPGGAWGARDGGALLARGKKKLTSHTLFQLHRPLIGPAGRQHRPGPCKCGERYQSAAAGAGAWGAQRRTPAAAMPRDDRFLAVRDDEPGSVFFSHFGPLMAGHPSIHREHTPAMPLFCFGHCVFLFRLACFFWPMTPLGVSRARTIGSDPLFRFIFAAAGARWQ